MTKKPEQNVWRIAETVDHKEVAQILEQFNVPEANRSIVNGGAISGRRGGVKPGQLV